VKAFVTGGTGFIGGRLIARLLERGDEVIALVRTPEKATTLAQMGATLLKGDVTDAAILEGGMKGVDVMFHVAGVYKVGIPAKERAAMFETNVTGTERVLDAAAAAGVPRIVYVSTVGVFGNTGGKIVDETYERAPGNWLSAYDESKFLGHKAAEDRASKGAPVVIVQPGGVYGPGDHSELGSFIDRVRHGKLPVRTFPGLGFNLVHVDDVVQGILLAAEKGQVGRSYVLGGEISTVGHLIDEVARLSGRKAPKATLPPPVMKAFAPLGPVIGPLMGLPSNLREGIRAADGVTYWAGHERAMRELGYTPRDLATGLAETLAALPD